jgi:adenylate kinase family enzyme
VKRILVVGMTGAGKTSAARRIAARLEVPFHEMDALALGPGWSTPPDLVPRVRAIAATPGWVFDSYGYPQVRDLLWAAADGIVWLDYPRRLVVWRAWRRSMWRTLRRERVFGGNRETLAAWFTPGHPVRHAWRGYDERRRQIAARIEAAPHIATVRLERPARLERWLDALPLP